MKTRKRTIAGVLAGVLAVTGASLMAAAPAQAASYPLIKCGSQGQYTASFTSTYAFTKTYSGNCGGLGARAHYAYNGHTYWTPFATGSSYVKATPGYNTVDESQNYTAYTATITVTGHLPF